MKRRELLIMSVAAAFLSACGGTAQDETQQSASMRGGGEDRAPQTTGGDNPLAFTPLVRACAALLLADPIPAEFAAAPMQYFKDQGFSAAVIADRADLINAVHMVTSNDFKTALAIGDTDFLFGTASSAGILATKHVEIFEHPASADIAKLLNEPMTIESQARLSAIVNRQMFQLIGNDPKMTPAAALLLAIAYAMVFVNAIPE